jgi:hypothetical protein
MKDRSTPNAKKARAFIAVVFSLQAGAGLARAEQPLDSGPVGEPPAAHADSLSSAPVEAAPSPAQEVVGATPPAAALPAPAVLLPAPARTAVESAAAEAAATSWFARLPLTLAVGEGAQRWAVTLYGFVEADFIFDTTRSYSDSIGSAIVARSDTYEGRVGRTQFSMRNTRLGFAFESPLVAGIKPAALFESDFFGHQDSPPDTSENTYFTSPTFRIRHAFVKLENPYLEVLAGQTYDLFGWQNSFSPCSVEFLGLPNQLFSRNMQLRLSHTFNPDGLVSLDVAVSAVRPAQRDAEIPDANAGLRVRFNGWKGITTPGNVGTTALPLSLGVSGTVRQFKVDAFTPPPVQNSNSATGWGLSLDAFIPLIPAASADNRGNRLTFIGSFVRGSGIADLITAGGGAKFPTLPNPTQDNPPPLYQADIDNGLVSFDASGVLHTIDWQAFRLGLQYYLPPWGGRMFLSANYTQAHSGNLAKLFPQGGTEIELLVNVADTSRYADLNLFWDATPAARIGLSGQYIQVEYLHTPGKLADKPHNIRGMVQTVYQF